MRNYASTAGLLVAALVVAGAGSGAATAIVPEAGRADRLVVKDRAWAAGLASSDKTWSASAVDYDRDGAEDVWIGYHGQGGKLWRNRGAGRYRQVATRAWPASNPAGKTIDRHDCAWADVDRNGRPDAYCSTGRFLRNWVKYGRDNELWLQSRRGRFRDVGTRWRVGDVCGRGRHVTFLHANYDKWPDLFVGNENPRRVSDECNRSADRLPDERSKILINRRGDGFRHDPRWWNFGAGPGTQCAEVLDFNGDGRDDLLTCRQNGQTPRLYYNSVERRRLVDVSSGHRLRGQVTDAVVADLDGDRDPDLVTSASRRFAYHLNVDGHFASGRRIGGTPGGGGASVAVGDADGDGDLDVYGMIAKGGRSNPDDVLYLNEGRAGDRVGFTDRSVPSASGAANEVVALQPRRSGRKAFLVLNGFGRERAPGRVQLIRMVRRG